MTERYQLVVRPTAGRALSHRLPEAVAASAWEFITTVLVFDPHRIGKPLLDDLDGYWSARRGEYRILYRIDDDKLTIEIVDIGHRRSIYRRR